MRGADEVAISSPIPPHSGGHQDLLAVQFEQTDRRNANGSNQQNLVIQPVPAMVAFPPDSAYSWRLLDGGFRVRTGPAYPPPGSTKGPTCPFNRGRVEDRSRLEKRQELEPRAFECSFVWIDSALNC